MDRILVVCGAGASSTFLVHWMRKGVEERRLAFELEPGNLGDLESRYSEVDVVLVGPHLATVFPDILRAASASGVLAALLPVVSFDAAGAAVALDIAYDLTERPRPAAPGSTSILEHRPRRNNA